MKKTLHIQSLCMISAITAVCAITAQLAIPLPTGVPITLQTFGIMLAGIILGAKKGALSALIYLLIGAVGVPVFSNFTGGYQCLVGPTGGFLLSFPLMAYINGLGAEHRTRFKGCFTLCLVLANIINLLIGTLFFCFLGNVSFTAGLTACVLPFIPATIVKMIAASALGLRIRKIMLSGV